MTTTYTELPSGAVIIEDNQRTPSTGSEIFIRCSKEQVYAYVNNLVGKDFWDKTAPAPEWADKAQGCFTRFNSNGESWIADYSVRFWVALTH